MEKKALKITVLLLLLFLLSNQQLFSQEDSHIQWTFEPRTDGSVHIEAVVTLMESTDSYTFLEFSDEIRIKNVKAYEYESGDLIEHKFPWERGKQAIMLIFNQSTPEPFTFGIEFDLADFMEEKKEKVFIFEWQYRSEEEKFHTAEIFLQKGAELLDFKYLEPVRMEEGEQVIIYYGGTSKGKNVFSFLLAFSSSGKDSMELGKHHEEKKDYILASFYYKKALSIYSRYNYFAETNPEILEELYERNLSVQKINADNTFEEATETFEQEEYEKAKRQFEKAEILYKALKDTEGESQCQEMITQCEKILSGVQKIYADNTFEEGIEVFEQEEYEKAKRYFRKAESLYRELEDTEGESQCQEMITQCEKLLLAKKAETLLEQGKTQYKTFKYPSATKSFFQAKDIFEELGNTEKISECEEWLDKIEAVYQTMLVCIGGTVVLSLVLWRRFAENEEESN